MVPLAEVVGLPETEEEVVTTTLLEGAEVTEYEDWALLEGAAELEAELEPPVEAGAETETVTPAWAQVLSTAEMTVAWSLAEQELWTQGVTDEMSESNFLQWHAKSVREEQPSEVKGVTKQLSYATVSTNCHLRVKGE